jgi:tetratricopeptide (TPR) repeat protein
MVAQLKQDPSQLKLWLTLGSYRKMAGDYEGARDAWEYVAAAAPSSFVAFNNLGDLYMNFLKNYPKAELNYRKVIAVRPDYIDTYRNLYTLYHYLYKTNTTAAADILKEGLKNNPNNPDLLAIQAQMKSGK